MLVPISWLKDFVNINITPEELSDKLVSCGFEIEEIIRLNEKIKNVVVGKIVSTEKHPNADKLTVCQIDIGTEVLQIVTGATNVKTGDFVPVAQNGAILPSGKTIVNGELRGVKSFGMLCGGSELELTDDEYSGASVDGIMLIHSEDSNVGMDINEVLGRNDIVLDVAITANRPDCNSIIGIAREVASVTNQVIKPFNFTFKTEKASKNLKIDNFDTALSPRYMGHIVEEIKITKSPKVIQNRLRAVGLRPINNIVDITNYVLMEVGQPMHAFDFDKIDGSKIVVRHAIDGEKIIALDGKSYTLDSTMLAICDAEKPMAIAGIMGGQYSAISDTTSSIVFESARFRRDNIRRSSKKLNLRSDSSARYEKGVDFYCQEIGMNRALNLIQAYGYGKVTNLCVDVCNSIEVKKLEINYNDVNKILGIVVPIDVMSRILNTLSIKTSILKDILHIEIPPFREDIIGTNDIAEEVIRIYGYDKIVPTLIKDATMVKGGKTVEQHLNDRVKSYLVGKGLSEIVSYSFITPKAFDMLKLRENSPLRQSIKVLNPIGEDMSVMRTTLAHSMIKTIQTNYLRGNKEMSFFEISKTYIPKAMPLTELPTENNFLAIGEMGSNCDFYSTKGIIEDLFDMLCIEVDFKPYDIEFMHRSRTAQIIEKSTNKFVGYLGEVSPYVTDEYNIDKKVYIAEIDIDYVISLAKTQRPFIAIPKFPAIERDIAVLCKTDINADAILNAIKDSNVTNLFDSYIFDVYQGEQVEKGYKSVAIKLHFLNYEKTLTDEVVNAEIKAILATLEEKIGAKLR